VHYEITLQIVRFEESRLIRRGEGRSETTVKECKLRFFDFFGKEMRVKKRSLMEMNEI